MLHSIEEVLHDIKKGKPIIVVDDKKEKMKETYLLQLKLLILMQ